MRLCWFSRLTHTQCGVGLRPVRTNTISIKIIYNCIMKSNIYNCVYDIDRI